MWEDMVVILSSLHKYVLCVSTMPVIDVLGQTERLHVTKDDLFKIHLVRYDYAHEHVMYAFCEHNQIHMPAKSFEFAGEDHMTAART